MNKRGFDCAFSRAVFSPIFYFSISFFPFFFSSILPRLLAPFFFLFLSCTPSGFEPLTFRIHLAYQSFFYTTTPPDSVELNPPKLIFILLDSLACPKNYHNNLLIHLFKRMLHAARLHENIHRICQSLENKSGGDDFISFSQSPPPELFLEIRFDRII